MGPGNRIAPGEYLMISLKIALRAGIVVFLLIIFLSGGIYWRNIYILHDYLFEARDIAEHVHTAEAFHSAMHEMVITAEIFIKSGPNDRVEKEFSRQVGRAEEALQKLVESAELERQAEPTSGSQSLRLVEDIVDRFQLLKKALDRTFITAPDEQHEYLAAAQALFDDIFHNYYLRLHEKHKARNIELQQNAHAIWKSMNIYFALQLVVAGLVCFVVIIFLDKFVLKLHTLTEQMAMKDALTSLYNRRYLAKLIDEEMSRFDRYGTPCSILMIDLDDFKKFNDRYGHQTGDKLLKETAAFFLKNVRKNDKVIRYGGEEFLCHLPETDHLNALQTAEKLRLNISRLSLSLPNGKEVTPVTVSIGVASCPPDGTVLYDLIEKADQRLYEAKSKGKNMVVGRNDTGSTLD